MAGGWSGRLGESCGGGGLDLLVGHWGCDMAGRGKRRVMMRQLIEYESTDGG